MSQYLHDMEPTAVSAMPGSGLFAAALPHVCGFIAGALSMAVYTAHVARHDEESSGDENLSGLFSGGLGVMSLGAVAASMLLVAVVSQRTSHSPVQTSSTAASPSLLSPPLSFWSSHGRDPSYRQAAPKFAARPPYYALSHHPMAALRQSIPVSSSSQLTVDQSGSSARGLSTWAAVRAPRRCAPPLHMAAGSTDGEAQTSIIDVVLLGVGGVGRELVSAILNSREFHARDYAVEFRFRAIVDSSGATDLSTASDSDVRAVLSHKEAGGSFTSLDGQYPIKAKGDAESASDFLVNLVSEVTSEASKVGGSVMVVDCTAVDDTAEALVTAVENGAKVVSANKKPFTGSQKLYERLVGAKPRNLGRVRFESSVGAAIPVIVGLHRTVAATDPVRRIAGTFSGTLGFVMTGLQNGEPFSEVVKRAKESGFTEPDPRDDLNGSDVARKALILARGMGWNLEMSDVDVEPLYPKSMDGLSVDEFMDRLVDIDADFASRVTAAESKGCVLRYAAEIEDKKLKVALAEVGADTPLGRLSGTDNLVEIHTKWYNPNPLVIQGAGAGTGTTAAGVLSDMVDLAFTSNDPFCRV